MLSYGEQLFIMETLYYEYIYVALSYIQHVEVYKFSQRLCWDDSEQVTNYACKGSALCIHTYNVYVNNRSTYVELLPIE